LSQKSITEHFEEIALDTADLNPAKGLIWVDIFLICPHGAARLQQFLHYLNILKPTVKFTVNVEATGILSFLEASVMKRCPKLVTKVYGKPIQTGHYLHFKSNHPYCVKKGSRSYFDQLTKVICHDQNDSM
jgi:hypothetical protein